MASSSALWVCLGQGQGHKISPVTYVLSITILVLQSNLVKQIQKHDQIMCAWVCACMCVPVCALGYREEGHVSNSNQCVAAQINSSSSAAIRTQERTRLKRLIANCEFQKGESRLTPAENEPHKATAPGKHSRWDGEVVIRGLLQRQELPTPWLG